MEEQKKEKKQLKISLGTAILLFIIILLITAMVVVAVYFKNEKPNTGESKVGDTEVTDTKKAFKYALKSNSLEDFDLRFLQLENERKNKIYSPLSIKYALAMLNEGTEGESKEQISNLIGDYKPNKYVNSANMSLANALFIRDTYKNSVKENFVNNLKTKYNADVEYDSFTSAKKMNSWISDKTLELIKDMIDDSSVSDLNFALINAVAIDMDWKDKFLVHDNYDNYMDANYQHEKYSWMAPQNLLSSNFEGVKNRISGMGIIASVNNYDIVNTLGEDNIRKTVGDAFRKYLNEDPDGNASYYLEGKNVETAVKEYLDEYIKEINNNYKMVNKNTDFYVYQDEKVKSFAKDLKEYNGTTLQYVAIMPEENLDKYISNITAEEINKIIGNLKDINKRENFKEGVITQVVGYFPKFKFDYDLNLIKDLNDMGVKDIFDENKANLKGITDEKACINQAKHKANIELTQDGIKAAAATFIGGAGAGEMFDYLYDVPVEKIDLTFDKPYMFVIRNKETGEVWFAGTVYEPLSLEDEVETKNEDGGVEDYSQFLKELEERNKQ